MSKRIALILALILSFTFLVRDSSYGQNSRDSTECHELTIYVIPSHLFVDWQNPSTLYKTTINSWLYSKLHKYSYFIGHLFIELNTTLLDEPIITSVRSTGNKEKKRLLFKEKIGLGIIGAAFPGRMETNGELLASIECAVKKDREIAFIKYRINKEAASRIIEYLEGFTTKDSNSVAPCDAYGGGFWPRYEKEGAGCSAFGIAAMEVAGLKCDYPEWVHRINIPADLVGGEFNNFIRVKNKDIKRRKTWYGGSGTANVDYFPFFIYDPTLIYNWIMEQREILSNNDGTSISQPFTTAIKKESRGTIPGLFMDARSVAVPVNDPVFKKRIEYSVFVDRFLIRK